MQPVPVVVAPSAEVKGKEMKLNMATTNKDAGQFLLKLAALCEEYRAEFSYTTDDNGVHITLDGQEVFVGFLVDGYAVNDLRTAAANWLAQQPA